MHHFAPLVNLSAPLRPHAEDGAVSRWPAVAPATVTILAPASSEEAVVEDVVEAAPTTLAEGWELLVVDDGSTDGTGTILTRLAGRHPLLRVSTHVRNRGLGSAPATGFAEATGDVVVTIDAELGHPLSAVEDLVAACGDADAAYGSRFVAGGGMPSVPRRAVDLGPREPRISDPARMAGAGHDDGPARPPLRRDRVPPDLVAGVRGADRDHRATARGR